MQDKKFEPSPRETWRITKNVVVIGLAFMMQFTAYCGASNLQSSINAEDGLGTASLAAVYAGLIFSNLFLPVFVIKWIGPKWAISLSFVTYMPWIASQMYPTFYTMIPAALILGLGGGPLWCSKCTYLAIVSEAYSQITKIPASALLTRFLGIFFMIFQLNQIWGNLISSLVITSGDNEAAVTLVNASLIPEICGANFLPSADSKEAIQHQPIEKIQMISGIYLACMACAALIVAVGVDSLKRYESVREKSGANVSGFALMAVTLRLLGEPHQIMIVLINIFVGYEQAFFGSDFTAAFVSCAVGTGSVGFVMLAFGVADALGCMLSGYLAKLTGRVPLVTIGAVVQSMLFITLLTWRPQANSLTVLYAVAVLWGLCDSIWMVQINAFSGCLFPGREEASFSNFRLWESVGYIIAYVISPHLRTSTKTYLMFGGMILGLALYYVVEYRQSREKKLKEEKVEKMQPVGHVNTAFQIAE
ncbi:UNC93-like protein [Aricia agestis]|uniref:UNC93-like protein n=1 Tax=Aricia agestis TaxID=91739 RepID=UPI001C2062F6|nr:UNC93-like protein [Aricia agestis]